MTHRRWQTSDEWQPPWSGPSGPPDHSMLLGRVLERTEHLLAMGQHTANSVDEIKDRLEEGDRKFDAHASRFDAHTSRLDEMHKTISDLQTASGKEKVTSLERWSKDLLRWAIPLFALWYTGSLDAAFKIASAMK